MEFNVSVGEGLAMAVAIANPEERSLHSITNQEVKQDCGENIAKILANRSMKKLPSKFSLIIGVFLMAIA